MKHITSASTKDLFTTLTPVTVEFEGGGIENGIIEFIPDFFHPNYFEVEDNSDGWRIVYPEWFIVNDLPEQTELGELHEIAPGVYEADDNSYGKVTIRVVA